MFFEPCVEVNTIVDTTAAEFDARNIELLEQRDADTEVCRCLFLRKATYRRQREIHRFHLIRSNLPDLRLPDVVRAAANLHGEASRMPSPPSLPL